ncbi:tight adherence protein B [Desulfofundulus australicus DSM 11792]|uniref:Tight adherence protein B n=1 Tax=Desulfofundulus australicus DSM 11792 TaxID=1121425 RepID=A0A1M4XX01_9FIRM|nr:tight adherence protein B [Desulfofundulus australicus DSM 11792]
MLVLLLFAALFLLLYTLAGGPLPEISAARNIFHRFALPVGCAAGSFVLASLVFGTPLAGLPWGVAGWFLPGGIRGFLGARRRSVWREAARNFIVSAAGMYAANRTTPEVVETAAGELPDPFSREFQQMLADRRYVSGFRFPDAFRGLAEKYGLPEFAAFAEIVEASERAGGPRAAARGLERLGVALRQRDRLLAERVKELAEPKVAGYVVVILLLAGLFFDATSLRGYYAGGAGKAALGLANAVTVGVIFMMRAFTSSRDLEGGI